MGLRRLKEAWEVKKGSEDCLTIDWTDDVFKPIDDLTNYQFRADAKYNLTDTDILFTLSNANGGFRIEDGPKARFNAFLSVADLALVEKLENSLLPIPFRRIFLDIEYDDGSNDWQSFLIVEVLVFEEGTTSN